MFPTKINHSCLECWSKNHLSVSVFSRHRALQLRVLRSACTVWDYVSNGNKKSSFLTGFPPLGSCCKSTGLYTCSSFTSASLYRTVPGLSFTMKVGPKRSEWEIRILRKRMAYMKKREREKHTMSGGGGESLPRLTPQSIRVDAYHMCSQSACFSLHHMVHAKRGLLLLLLCWQRGNTVINNWKVMELRREMMKTFTKFALSNFFQ